MNVHEAGAGTPLILVPGIQGRWEWMRPTVTMLARRFRVVTFSLCDEPTSGIHHDATRGFDVYLDQILAVMNDRGIERAVICGVSYGGLIAAAFAARYPARVSSLVLASALPPGWRGDRRTAFYLRAPLLLSPLFLLSSIRLFPEMRVAFGSLPAAVRFALTHGWNVVTHPTSPLRMARRIRLLAPLDLVPALARLKTDTLIVTGEDVLDNVVAPVETRRYLTLWPHAGAAVLERTGHLGTLTRPEAFLTLVDAFVHQSAQAGEERRRIG
jgi:pimeloyl-ACP methyl ester carboxylesterase